MKNLLAWITVPAGLRSMPSAAADPGTVGDASFRRLVAAPSEGAGDCPGDYRVSSRIDPVCALAALSS